MHCQDGLRLVPHKVSKVPPLQLSSYRPGAWAASKTPPWSGRTWRRVARRLGRKTAALAVAHTSVVRLSYGLLAGPCDEASRDARHAARAAAREKHRALAALARWGDHVLLSPVAEAAHVPAPSLRPRRLASPCTDQDSGCSAVGRLPGESISWELQTPLSPRTAVEQPVTPAGVRRAARRREKCALRRLCRLLT